MTQMKGHINQASQDMGDAAKDVAYSKSMTIFARIGYAVRGIVYVLIGLLAIELSVGHGGKTTDQTGALQTINQQPFGGFLLAVVAIGLFGYAIWSLFQAILDTEHKGKKTMGIIGRIGYAITGISYGLLAYGGIQTVMSGSSHQSSSTKNTQDWTARLLHTSFGVPLLVLVGIIVIGLGGYLCFRAYKADFVKHLSLYEIQPNIRKMAVFAGRFGYAALGIVFVIIGIFLFVAAVQHNAYEAKGLDGALQVLSQQPFGAFMLGVVALGMLSYGVYSFVEARYRRIGVR
ncbi:hypothetical protein KSC_049760 [Ktedonobacter sp. SOSP1-52]|uniref:DUF1206 domain-containing protein n=1 Tax=Ktedonobacter sp. SOSP1-52 TaxID=2778366 RepID=UPI00191611D8|nr:DUF1206 domain-containing protein [Ktedonobacter sp. SOSP1-52]GHO66084.1 hypothetical protein KSC_049760 [Ktedonobacter sp. SOSP1-52]